MRKGLIVGGALSASMILGSSAMALYQQPQGGAAPAAATVPGASAAPLFQQRCAVCHDPAVERAPSREDMRQRQPADVVQVLTSGSMAPMAAGMTPEQIRELAQFVTGKSLAPATPPAGPGGGRAGGGGGGGGGGRGGAAVAQPADNMCATNPTIRTGNSDWNGFGKDLSATRFQTNTTLNAGNVPRLKVKWAFSIAGGRYGQPTVIGDHLFVSGGAGHVYSLDAKTGCVHWRKMITGSPRTSPVVERRPGLSPSGWVVYVGSNSRDVYALDAMTGNELWKVNVEDHPRAVLTGHPVLHQNTLYVPISSLEETMGTTAAYGCCTFSGAVAAIDVRTGKIIWKTKVLEDAKPTRKNAAGTQMFGPAGAAIWSQPTIDARRNQLYVATGDSYTEIDAPRSDAIVAIDLRTGKINWHNQVTKNDNFLIGCGGRAPAVNCPAGLVGPDYDFGSSPILRNLPGGKQVVLSGQKSGVAYGMDPDTGTTLWSTKVGAGSALGGIEWGMAADSRNLYAGVADIGVPVATAKPGLNAIDIATGKVVWSTPAPRVPCAFQGRCHPGQSAAVSVIPGVVFAGGQDGWFRGYSATEGKILWEFNALGQTYKTVNGVAEQRGGSFDGPGPVISGGMVYIMSGFSGASGVASNPLNVLLAFSVEGK